MKFRTTLAALGVAGIAAGLFVVQGTRSADAAPPSEAQLAAEAEIQSRDIAFFEMRAQRDPFSALDRARLASLYLQRSRQTGDHDDVLRAEATASETPQPALPSRPA
jgi:hypothetical protein